MVPAGLLTMLFGPVIGEYAVPGASGVVGLEVGLFPLLKSDAGVVVPCPVRVEAAGM
jgi:hypothetical protein